MKKELTDRLEDRNVLQILESLNRGIQRKIPDGKSVHLSPKFRQKLELARLLYEHSIKSEDGTFREYREKNNEEYQIMIELIYKINNLGISI